MHTYIHPCIHAYILYLYLYLSIYIYTYICILGVYIYIHLQLQLIWYETFLYVSSTSYFNVTQVNLDRLEPRLLHKNLEIQQGNPKKDPENFCIHQRASTKDSNSYSCRNPGSFGWFCILLHLRTMEIC